VPFMSMMPAKYRHSQIGDKVHKLARILNAEKAEHLYRLIVSTNGNPKAFMVKPPDLEIIPQEWLGKGSFVEQMMYYDAVTYLPDDIMAKVDRASMGASLETR